MTGGVGTDDFPWCLAALRALPKAMLVLDEGGRVQFANACVQQIFGYAPPALAGRLFETLLTTDCQARFRTDLAACLAPGSATPLKLDLLAVAGDGHPFPIKLSLGHARAGGASLAVAVVRDLTAQRTEEQQHKMVAVEEREARERLEALLGFAPAFIIAISSLGTIDFINRTLPHHDKKDVIGSSWLKYFPPERQALMTAELMAMYATEATRTFETVTSGPCGEALWFESHLAPIRIGGEIVGAVLVSQDITERKRAHAELLAGRQMALLGTLAAGVAHEINTPIQFVGDSVQFLRDSARDLLALLDRFQELRREVSVGRPVEEIIEAARAAEMEADLPYIRENMPAAFDRCIDGLSRVTTIVRSLKDFAHPTDKEMAPADLNRAIATTVTIATNEYKYVATVVTDFGELPPVTCYVGEISQAVLNVLVNAAHAIGSAVAGSDRKGVITVRTRQDGDTVVISIGDTGAGIPEDIRSRIFDPFFTTKEVGKGTGQGLAIARASVKERHGGELTFESEVGKGTTFFIRIPIQGRGASA